MHLNLALLHEGQCENRERQSRTEQPFAVYAAGSPRLGFAVMSNAVGPLIRWRV